MADKEWLKSYTGDLAAALQDALQTATRVDVRAADGAARGGRKLAAQVIERVLAEGVTA